MLTEKKLLEGQCDLKKKKKKARERKAESVLLEKNKTQRHSILMLQGISDNNQIRWFFLDQSSGRTRTTCSPEAWLPANNTSDISSSSPSFPSLLRLLAGSITAGWWSDCRPVKETLQGNETFKCLWIKKQSRRWWVNSAQDHVITRKWLHTGSYSGLRNRIRKTT